MYQPTAMGPRQGRSSPARGRHLWRSGWFARFLDPPLTTQTRPISARPGLHASVEGSRPYSLVHAVGSGDDPQGRDDGAAAQVVALELEAGLPGPLGQQGHVPAHDARAVARPQAAGCRGRTAAGRRARPPLLSPVELTARGEGRGRSPRRGTAGALWGVLGRTHQSKDPDAGSSRSEMPTPHAGAGEPSAGPPHLRRCWRACTCLASAAGTSPHCRQGHLPGAL